MTNHVPQSGFTTWGIHIVAGLGSLTESESATRGKRAQRNLPSPHPIGRGIKGEGLLKLTAPCSRSHPWLPRFDSCSFESIRGLEFEVWSFSGMGGRTSAWMLVLGPRSATRFQNLGHPSRGGLGKSISSPCSSAVGPPESVVKTSAPLSVSQCLCG